ncbi:MAG: hypothetical protein U0Q12_26600 [Vicinamibacterales bacterium]
MLTHVHRAFLTGALLTMACGGSPSAPTTPRPTAAIAATATPQTWTIGPCTGCGDLVGELETGGVVVVTESAGVGLIIGALEVSALNASGAVTNNSPRPSLGTRLAGNGRVELDVGYHFPPSAQAAAARIVVHGRDDNGHDVSATLTVALRQ